MISAIIPAAGWGTRFLPATKVVPKELFPLGNKPIIHHIVDEALAAGIRNIIIILNKHKESIRHYFESGAMDAMLRQQGKEHLLNDLEELRKKTKLTFVYQEEQRGLGHAILCAKDIVNHDVAILFGDAVTRGKKTGTEELQSVYEEMNASVMGLERTTPEEVHLRGMVDGEQCGERLWKVKQIVERPKTFPTTLASSARYILKKKIMEYLQTQKPGFNNEVQLTDAVMRLAQDEDVYAYLTESTRYDLGSPHLYAKAVWAYEREEQ